MSNQLPPEFHFTRWLLGWTEGGLFQWHEVIYTDEKVTRLLPPEANRLGRTFEDFLSYHHCFLFLFIPSFFVFIMPNSMLMFYKVTGLKLETPTSCFCVFKMCVSFSPQPSGEGLLDFYVDASSPAGGGDNCRHAMGSGITRSKVFFRIQF